ncbi:MAG: hypothetical protein M3O03_07635 [Pseudomonadota bacterium]|nr:hypothetical protein [Pseudomonadota bacterium]
MKVTSILLTIALVSTCGVASIPSASAQATPPATGAQGNGQHDCKGGLTYDVMKGKCIPTVGATSYSPTRTMHKHHKKHMNKKHMMKPATTAN